MWDYLYSLCPDYFSKSLFIYGNNIFDFVGYYYLIARDYYRYLIPKSTHKIEKILLYYGEGEQIDLTKYINQAELNYDDLNDFLRKTPGLPPLLGDQHQLHLEIVYRHSEKKYRVMYNADDNINFPLYDTNEVVSHNVIDTYQNGVLSAFYQEKDVTDLIKQYAGPKGNFYHDRDIYITMDKMKYILHSYRDKNDKEHILIITDNFAEDHIFKDKQKIVLKVS